MPPQELFKQWCRRSTVVQAPDRCANALHTAGLVHGICTKAPITIRDGEVLEISGLFTVKHDVQVEAGGKLIVDFAQLILSSSGPDPEISAGRARGAWFKHPFAPDFGCNRSFYNGQPLLEYDPVGGLIVFNGERHKTMSMYRHMRPCNLAILRLNSRHLE